MEEPHMPETWMSVVEAAASLKVHTRTIERRIAAGKIQARRANDGLLQVLIAVPESPDNAPDPAMETLRELADSQVSLVTGSASALVKFAQDDAANARHELERVRHEADRARRSSTMAWGAVATLGLGVCLAVGWTVQKITRANDDVRHLSNYAEQMEHQASQLRLDHESALSKIVSERDAARHDAELAKLASAEASGRLAAYVEQAQLVARQTPTTRPATFIQRVLAAIEDPSDHRVP